MNGYIALNKLLKSGIKFSLLSLFIFTVSLFFFPEPQAADKSKTIKIAIIEYPPLMGKKGGIMIEVVTKAFKTQNIEINYEILPIRRLVLSIKKGLYPAAIGSEDWFRKANLADTTYAVPVAYTGLHFFSLKEKFPEGVKFEKLEDLKKYKIGYVRGGSLSPLFEKAKLSLTLVNLLSQNVKKVYIGRDDMFAATDLGGWAIIKQVYPDKISKFSVSKKAIHQISGDVVFSKKNQGLINKFQRGLNVVKKNGTYLEIAKRYYPNGKVPPVLLELADP